MRYLTVLVLTAALASVASAQITGSVVVTDPTPGLGAGWVTNDIVVQADSDWLSAMMVVLPDASGMIYQDTYGSANPQSPDPLFVAAFPTLAYDTYVGNGVLGESVSTAAAVDMGQAAILFDTNVLAIAWYTSDDDDLGSLDLARITLGDQAQGTWEFRATASPSKGPATVMVGQIINGELVVIPEPATMALLAVGGIGMLIRRKRSRS